MPTCTSGSGMLESSYLMLMGQSQSMLSDPVDLDYGLLEVLKCANLFNIVDAG